VPANLATAQNEVEFNISDATYDADKGSVAVTFFASDPSNSDAKYDLTDSAGPFGSGASMNLGFAWDSGTDYSNTGSGSTPATPLIVNVLTSLGTSAVVDNGDNTYTLTASLPDEAQAAGSGAAFIYGHPLGDGDGDGVADAKETMDIKSPHEFFAITDSSVQDRRDVVDIAKCDSCHGFIAGHGGLRSDNPQVCATCHNPNATDISRRPDSASDALDGKGEESIDFKRMIHGLHASGMREKPLTYYGFTGPATFDEEEVTFPGELNKCDACHESEAYWLPLADGVLASTIDTGADVADPADDLNITQSAAVCSSCHDSEKAATHMEQNGASFEVLDANIMFY
jgi:OmcA/MtrC family decaheme c-type cytochrome